MLLDLKKYGFNLVKTIGGDFYVWLAEHPLIDKRIFEVTIMDLPDSLYSVTIIEKGSDFFLEHCHRYRCKNDRELKYLLFNSSSGRMIKKIKPTQFISNIFPEI